VEERKRYKEGGEGFSLYPLALDDGRLSRSK